jgi:hypothetical protein
MGALLRGRAAVYRSQTECGSSSRESSSSGGAGGRITPRRSRASPSARSRTRCTSPVPTAACRPTSSPPPSPAICSWSAIPGTSCPRRARMGSRSPTSRRPRPSSFALDVLEVRDIIVCGHSGWRAMAALAAGRENVRWPHLRSWLRHGDAAAERLRQGEGDPERTPQDRLSQLNVLLQLEHLRSYEPVRRHAPGLHPWWFEIATAEVHAWDPGLGRFRPIDDDHAAQILQRIKR